MWLEVLGGRDAAVAEIAAAAADPARPAGGTEGSSWRIGAWKSADIRRRRDDVSLGMFNGVLILFPSVRGEEGAGLTGRTRRRRHTVQARRQRLRPGREEGSEEWKLGRRLDRVGRGNGINLRDACNCCCRLWRRASVWRCSRTMGLPACDWERLATAIGGVSGG
jgi:hypothetical protein